MTLNHQKVRKYTLIVFLSAIAIVWVCSLVWFYYKGVNTSDIDMAAGGNANNNYAAGLPASSFHSTSYMLTADYRQEQYQLTGISLPQSSAFQSCTPMAYLSSEAEVRSIGGGAGHAASLAAVSGNSNNNNNNTATPSYAMTLPVRPRTTSVAQAAEAISGGVTTDETAVTMGIMQRNVSTMAKAPGYDPEDPWKTPAGGTPWAVMLLLAAAFCYRQTARKRS